MNPAVRLIKKTLFAPLFFVNLLFFNFQVAPFIKNPYLMLSTDLGIYLNFLYLLLTLMISGICAVTFYTLANDAKIILPITLVCCLAPLFVFAIPINILLCIGVLLSLFVIYWNIKNTMKSYLTFSPRMLLTPSVKNLVTLILLVTSIGFYQSVSREIKQHGITIPDSLLDFSTQISNGLQQQNAPQAQTNVLNQDQLNALRANPQLLKKAGLNPNILNSITAQNSSPASLTKSLLKQQIESFLKPYEAVVAPIFALLFFVTLSSLASLISFVISPIIWLIFFIFEQTGFITFTLETRQVKKLVV